MSNENTAAPFPLAVICHHCRRETTITVGADAEGNWTSSPPCACGSTTFETRDPIRMGESFKRGGLRGWIR